jgi:hypothetical protein
LAGTVASPEAFVTKPLPITSLKALQAAEEKCLRIEDDADKHAQYKQFVADLKVCAKIVAKAA